MIPLGIFLLACAAVYLGAIDAAFSALMRLSLRFVAERSNRPGALTEYLDDPLLLFIPVRLMLGLVTGSATALLSWAMGVGAQTISLVMLAVAGFVIVCELLLPLLIVGRDPERMLEILLPSFAPLVRMLGPMTRQIARSVASAKRPNGPSVGPDETAEDASDAAKAFIDTAEHEGIIEGEERRLLQSIVDFGDTLVREVMTPRPDIVAIQVNASVSDLRALFREQEYSRFPVYRESLDNIAGFVFVKDLVALHHQSVAASRGRAGDQTCTRASQAVPASAHSVRNRRRRVRRDGRAGDDRRPARGNRRRDPRRIRR
jgi:putative hemolysin